MVAPTPPGWPDLLERGHVPVLKMRSAGHPDRPWTHARRALSVGDANTLWSKGLKLCHMFGLRDEPARTLAQRSLRNLALLNYFVFPNGSKHFHTLRDGWSETKNTLDLGESPAVCGYAFHELVRRIRSVAPRLPERFLAAAGAAMPVRPSGELRLTISRRTR